MRQKNSYKGLQEVSRCRFILLLDRAALAGYRNFAKANYGEVANSPGQEWFSIGVLKTLCNMVLR